MCVVSEERVGGRAGTAAPQGVVCELPNPPILPPASASISLQKGTASCVELRRAASLHRTATALHPRRAGCEVHPAECWRMIEFQYLNEPVDERNARQVKARVNKQSKSLGLVIVLLALHTMAASTARTGEPVPRRLENVTKLAFDHYVALTQARNDEELKRDTNLLWVDGLAEGPRTESYAALKRGEVKMQKLETLDNRKSIPCPGGMIHHWAGLIFIPGAKLEEVLSTEHAVDYFHDAPGKAHSRSSAVRIAEAENAGKSDEREKTAGNDGGYLWRMETWWRIEEGGGGVYVQSEVASLTRNIPMGLGWMIEPFITSIPRETLKFTLEAARKAVEGNAAKPKERPTG